MRSAIPTFRVALVAMSIAAASCCQAAAWTAPPAARVIVCGVDRGFAWSNPFAPEPIWPVGGALFRYFDPSIVVVSGRDIAEIVARTEQQLDERGIPQIARIEFWTHGGVGWFRIQQRRHGLELFDRPTGPTAAALGRLRDRLADDSVVHFRSCSTFHGMKGYAMAACASRYFNATGKHVVIMGHTRPTGITHPGWKTVLPGEVPRWRLDDGATERGLRGTQIVARDLSRIFSGYAYEAYPTAAEGALRLLGRFPIP